MKKEEGAIMRIEKKLKLIAHRGGKGFGVENTKEAFLGAISQKYDGVECDIQPTLDHELVVFHDLSLKRLCGIDKMVKECTLEECLAATLTKTDFGVMRTGKMLTFEEFLTLLYPTNLICFIELKESCTMKEYLQAISMLKKHHFTKERYVIIGNSCVSGLLSEIKNNDPTINVQFLARTSYQDYLPSLLKQQIGLDFAYSILQEDEFHPFLHYAISNHISTNVWVVNNSEEVEKLKQYPIDFITTDILQEENLQ
jgi:glycerophosphoryl diester phosphodiesterase